MNIWNDLEEIYLQKKNLLDSGTRRVLACRKKATLAFGRRLFWKGVLWWFLASVWKINTVVFSFLRSFTLVCCFLGVIVLFRFVWARLLTVIGFVSPDALVTLFVPIFVVILSYSWIQEYRPHLLDPYTYSFFRRLQREWAFYQGLTCSHVFRLRLLDRRLYLLSRELTSQEVCASPEIARRRLPDYLAQLKLSQAVYLKPNSWVEPLKLEWQNYLALLAASSNGLYP